MAGGINRDRRWQTVDRDGSHDSVGLCIDHRDCAGLSVDDINFIAYWVWCQLGGICANLQGSILTKVNQIKHGDSVRAAVANVCELSVAIRDVGKAVSSTTRSG